MSTHRPCNCRMAGDNCGECDNPPEPLTQEEYDARLAAQIVEWEEHPEVYERWLRANEPSKLWKELRAIKCKFMGLPYSDLDLE